MPWPLHASRRRTNASDEIWHPLPGSGFEFMAVRRDGTFERMSEMNEWMDEWQKQAINYWKKKWMKWDLRYDEKRKIYCCCVLMLVTLAMYSLLRNKHTTLMVMVHVTEPKKGAKPSQQVEEWIAVRTDDAYEWMNEWMSKWMNEWMNEWMNG